jgi:MEMO1 family protein
MTHAPQPPKFDPAAAHMHKPKVRPLRGMPVEAQDQQGNKLQMLGLADARQVMDQMVVVPMAAQVLIPLMDGSRDHAQIIAQVGRGLTTEILQGIVAQLDQAGLLEGPTFSAMHQKIKRDFDASPVLPPASTAAFAEMLGAQALGQEASEDAKVEAGAKKMTELFDTWISESLKNAADPSLDALPKAIVAPHLDYPRGWMNYAAIYGRLRVVDVPDRVVILGTNHFGSGTGVVGCNKGYQTPLGTLEVDQQMVDGLRSVLGEKLFAERYDHEREHSIELHVPWIQHVFGRSGSGPRIFGALIHDPCVNSGESYDGAGVSLEQFVAALKQTLARLPGTTLIVSSADLSHMGPAFGDQQPLIGDDQAIEAERSRIVQHDVSMLKMVQENKPGELIAAMAWQQNPTRWCSIGNLAATLMVVEPSEVKLLNYAAAIDQQGMAMVSSAAMVMV